MLKGLQGEIEEVLNGISLSVNVLKALYRTYDFCCANMELFFKVGLDLQNTSQGGNEVGSVWPRRLNTQKCLTQTRPLLSLS